MFIIGIAVERIIIVSVVTAKTIIIVKMTSIDITRKAVRRIIIASGEPVVAEVSVAAARLEAIVAVGESVAAGN